MFSPCSKTLNIAEADWKLFFSKSWLRIFLTSNAISSYRVFKILCGERKEKKFPVAFIYNYPNIILNESSNIVYICVKIALAPCFHC